MKSTIIAMLLGAAQVFAAPVDPRPHDHVPATLDGVRLIHPKSATRNHIVIVNVGHAVPDAMWAPAVTYAVSRVQLNVWTNTLGKSLLPAPLMDPSVVQRTFGDKAKVAVFVESNDHGPDFAQVPGSWSMVNVRKLTRDSPDAQTLKDRYAKMVLKGLVHASGGGATLDDKCSCFYESFTLKGMDKTGIQVSPMTYFPMLETLRGVGGTEILAPYMDPED